MTIQPNFSDGELDLDSLNSGTKKKYAKIMSVPAGKSTFRILPVTGGKKPFVEHWYQWFKFVTTTPDGESKTFWSTGKTAEFNNPIRVKLQAIGKRKSELEKAHGESVVNSNGQTSFKVNEEKLPKDIQTEYRKLKAAERYLKSTRHVFCNAATLDGSHTVLRMPKTAYELVKNEVIRLKNEGETLNALSLSDSTTVAEGKTTPSFGVWFDFDRTGEGLGTKYVIKVRKTRTKVEINGKTLIDEQFDHTPLSDEIQSNYASMVVDLDTLIPSYTNEELTEILKGNKKVVDLKNGYTPKETSGASEQEVSSGDALEGLSLDDSEVSALQDDIPTIDL